MNTALMLPVIAHAKLNRIEGLPKMAAFIFTADGRIIAGQNKRKTHPLQAQWGNNAQAIFLHAEIDALVQAIRYGIDLHDATCYVARVNKRGHAALAKPCAGCMGALIHFGISDIRWTE